MCALHGAAIRRLGAAAYDDHQVDAWDRDREPSDYPVDEPGVTFLVAQRDDRIVGFGECRPEPADYFESVPATYGEIRAVYVHPDAAREGVGSALLDRLERAASDAGVAGLGLWASKNAVGFYERRGYDRLGVRCHEFGDSGVTGAVVEMAREL